MKRKTIFIVTHSVVELNYRAEQLLRMGDSYDIILISNKAPERLTTQYSLELIKGYKNPVRIFAKIGLRSFANKLDQVLYFPSPKILFVQKAQRVVESYLNSPNRSDSILITINPPHDLALLGIALKKKFPKLFWINDLQDFWSYDEYYFDQLSPKMQNRALEVERELFRVADKLVVTNEFAKELLISKYKVLSAKLESIYHPYTMAPAEVNAKRRADLISRIKNRKKIRFAFVGELFKPPKVPGKLLLQELNNFVREFGWPVELTLIGSSLCEELKKGIDKDFVINKLPKLAHDEAYKEAVKSDFLILLLGDVPNANVIMHAKYPHYLALRIPIIAIVPDSSFIKHSIRKLNAGITINVNSQVFIQLYEILISLTESDFIKFGQVDFSPFSCNYFIAKWKMLLNKI